MLNFEIFSGEFVFAVKTALQLKLQMRHTCGVKTSSSKQIITHSMMSEDSEAQTSFVSQRH